MRMTDADYAARLRRMARAALRENRDRRFPMPWAEVSQSGMHNYAELQYAAAAAPSVVLRLLRRLERMER